MDLIALMFIMLLAGCTAATKQVGTETRSPDSLYRRKCAVCHRLYPPRNHAYSKFQAYVAKYGKGLNAEERQRLLEYLKENAKQE